MDNNLSASSGNVYFAPVRRYLYNALIGLALAGFFSLFILFPVEEQLLLHVFGYIGVAFSLWLAFFSATYVLTGRPSLILDAEGIHYRVAMYKTLFVPWRDCKHIAIQTSSASFRSKTFTSRFISVYVKDPGAVLRELPLVQRGLAWLGTNMGYSPLSISAAIVNAPLEEVHRVMHQYMNRAGSAL